MKIVCGSCSAKYSIADEKVQGKVFKIRCRKCSNVIVVKGTNDEEGEDSYAASAASHGGTAGAQEWYVVIDGEQAGPLTPEELEGYYTSGQVTLESYIWRDGMADWTPLGEVDTFAHLANGAMAESYGSDYDDLGMGAGASSDYSEDATAVVDANAWRQQQEAQDQAAAAAAAGAAGAAAGAMASDYGSDYAGFDAGFDAGADDPYASGMGSDPYGSADAYGMGDGGQDMSGIESTSSPYDDPYGTPAQAEMPGYSGLDAGFGSEPADLYGDAGDAGYSAQASVGGDADGGGLFSGFDADAANDGGLAYQSFSGLDSLEASGVDLGGQGIDGSASAQESDPGYGTANDLVGSRNENSVLFSLSSLQQVEAVKAPSDDVPLTDGSGLIDIQSLASAHKSMSGGGSGGGGASSGPATPFDGPASSPAPETFSPATMSVPAIMPRGSHRDNKPLIIAVVGLAVLLLAGAVGAAVYFANQKPAEPQVVVQKEIIREVAAANDSDDKGEEAAALALKAAELAKKEQELNELAKANAEQEEPEEDDKSSSKKSRSGSSRKKSASTSTAPAKDSTPEPPKAKSSSSKSDIDDLLNKIDNKGDSKKDSGSTKSSSSSSASDAPAPSKKKLGKADVQGTVRKYNSRVKSCATKSNSGNLKGKVWVAFTVAPSGKVSSASIASSNFKGTDVGNCVLKVVRSMKFPAAKESTTISKYPFFL